MHSALLSSTLPVLLPCRSPAYYGDTTSSAAFAIIVIFWRYFSSCSRVCVRASRPRCIDWILMAASSLRPADRTYKSLWCVRVGGCASAFLCVCVLTRRQPPVRRHLRAALPSALNLLYVYRRFALPVGRSRLFTVLWLSRIKSRSLFMLRRQFKFPHLLYLLHSLRCERTRERERGTEGKKQRETDEPHY